MLWGMGRLLLPGPQGLGHSASAEIAAQAPFNPPPEDPTDPQADRL